MTFTNWVAAVNLAAPLWRRWWWRKGAIMGFLQGWVGIPDPIHSRESQRQIPVPAKMKRLCAVVVGTLSKKAPEGVLAAADYFKTPMPDTWNLNNPGPDRALHIVQDGLGFAIVLTHCCQFQCSIRTVWSSELGMYRKWKWMVSYRETLGKRRH